MRNKKMAFYPKRSAQQNAWQKKNGRMGKEMRRQKSFEGQRSLKR